MWVGSFGRVMKHKKKKVSVHLWVITGCEMSAKGCKVHGEFRVNIALPCPSITHTHKHSTAGFCMVASMERRSMYLNVAQRGRRGRGNKGKKEGRGSAF